MRYIKDFRGFSLWDDPPYEGVTKFPIKVTYQGKYIDHFETVEDAIAEIKHMPEWLRYRIGTTEDES